MGSSSKDLGALINALQMAGAEVLDAAPLRDDPRVRDLARKDSVRFVVTIDAAHPTDPSVTIELVRGDGVAAERLPVFRYSNSAPAIFGGATS